MSLYSKMSWSFVCLHCNCIHIMSPHWRWASCKFSSYSTTIKVFPFFYDDLNPSLDIRNVISQQGRTHAIKVRHYSRTPHCSISYPLYILNPPRRSTFTIRTALFLSTFALIINFFVSTENQLDVHVRNYCTALLNIFYLPHPLSTQWAIQASL